MSEIFVKPKHRAYSIPIITLRNKEKRFHKFSTKEFMLSSKAEVHISKAIHEKWAKIVPLRKLQKSESQKGKDIVNVHSNTEKGF